LNTIILVGKVMDIELPAINSDAKLARMRVACNRLSDNKEKEIFEVNLWRDLAEKQYPVNKTVMVKGRLSANNLEREDKTFYNAVITAEKVTYIDES